jgi:hypothetical protein
MRMTLASSLPKIRSYRPTALALKGSPIVSVPVTVLKLYWTRSWRWVDATGNPPPPSVSFTDVSEPPVWLRVMSFPPAKKSSLRLTVVLEYVSVMPAPEALPRTAESPSRGRPGEIHPASLLQSLLSPTQVLVSASRTVGAAARVMRMTVTLATARRRRRVRG